MDGEKLDAEGLKAVSKWPSREEQISLLVGQILGPGSRALRRVARSWQDAQ